MQPVLLKGAIMFIDDDNAFGEALKTARKHVLVMILDTFDPAAITHTFSQMNRVISQGEIHGVHIPFASDAESAASVVLQYEDRLPAEQTPPI